MPKYTVTFRVFDYKDGPPCYGHFMTGDGPGNTPEEALAAAKRETPSGTDFRVFEMVDVTPKPKYRYVVDIVRPGDREGRPEFREALVYEAESALDAANMARKKFGITWIVADVSNIISMKNLLEGTDVLG